MLAASQRALCERFARPGDHDLNPDEYDKAITGAPLLMGCLARFDCKLWDTHEAGDHLVMIGEIVHVDRADGEPLIYSGRRFLKGLPISG